MKGIGRGNESQVGERGGPESKVPIAAEQC